MKKLYIMILIGLLFVVGCSASADGNLIHEDIISDTNQLLEITEKANEEKRDLEEQEQELFEDYKYKYYVGKFFDGDSEYEMNDLEKELVREVYGLELFVNPSDTLASEKNGYDTFREDVDELLEADEIPEDLVDKYPTYEKQTGINETFLKDAKEVFNFFDTAEGSVDARIVESFLNNYTYDHIDVDGVLYMHNELSDDIWFHIKILNDEMWEKNKLNLHYLDDLEHLIERAEKY